MSGTEPQVTLLVRKYVEIEYAAAPGGHNKVIFPLRELSDVVVQLASLLPSDAPPVKTE